MFASKSKLQKFQVSLQRETKYYSRLLYHVSLKKKNKVKTNSELSAERNIFKFRRLLLLSTKIKDNEGGDGHMRVYG